MKEQFYNISKEEFNDLLKNKGRFIALASEEEVIWAPLGVGITHEQIAQAFGKDPRLPENCEWFEEHVRLRYDLNERRVWWTFALVENPTNFFYNRRAVKKHYRLGFRVLNRLAAKYPELKGLKLELADVGGLYQKYACVSTFKQTNGKWELQEMSIEEEAKGTTLKEAKVKYS